MGKTWPALDIFVPSCTPTLQELVLAELDDFQPTAIQEPDDRSTALRAFFSGSENRDAAARALSAGFGRQLFLEAVDVADEDWAARSQAGLRSVEVGRIIVAPPWDAGRAEGKILIVIRPSMGFGTGHHATTRLMLNALQSVELRGRTVMDVGCGSGVLAIAAVGLGARSAVGVDIDPDAVANAADNAQLNPEFGGVEFLEQDFRDVSAKGDVVLANLTGGLLERTAAKLAQLVNRGGDLIVSGFMDNEPRVVPSLEAFFTLEKVDSEDGWQCARLRH